MYEIFDRTKYTKGKEAISFQTCGRLGISKKLSEKLKVKDFSHAVLYYDKNSNKAAVALTKKKTKDSYRLTIGKAGTTVRAAHFIEKLHIETPQRNVLVEQIEHKEDEIWLIFEPKVVIQ